VLDGMSDVSWNRRSCILAFVALRVSGQHDTSIYFALLLSAKVRNVFHFAEFQPLVKNNSHEVLCGESDSIVVIRCI
jgi:hypothetical protein